jgi:monofunctional glycosyltransferase
MRTFIKKTVLIAILTPFVLGLFYLVYPDVSALKGHNPAKTAFMRYRENEWTKKGEKKTIRQTWVPLGKISPYVRYAVTISEDDKFWQHEGFDFAAMKDALIKDIDEKEFKYGASTISQQLAKNLYLSPSKNPLRKLQEAIITWRLERTLPKERILELYLNVAEWGDGIFGIEEAAKKNFGKPASALTPMESALLAVILPNPLKLRAQNPSAYIQKRANTIYSRMQRRDVVPQETAEPNQENIETETTEEPLEELMPVDETNGEGNGKGIERSGEAGE